MKDCRARRWRHLHVSGKTVHLRYAIRRVHCDACEAVKAEHVSWASPGSHFARAFEERAVYLAQQSSRTAVSKLLRVTWRTVGGIITRVVRGKLEASGDRLDGLRHIGIDELNYRRHHRYVTVVVDHERGVVVWSSKGKNAETLRAFFEELRPERCVAIESVMIDMSQAYISVVKDLVPHARLVLDRFHVQRLVQDVMDETRREEVCRATTTEGNKSLKHTRRALLKSPWNLTGAQDQTLDELEQTNRPLFCGYLLKESLAGILDRRRINVARDMLLRWIAAAKASGLEHFARAARTIERYQDGILEYFRTGFNNGRTEGLNGKIRTLTRRAFGVHSASALISMIFRMLRRRARHARLLSTHELPPRPHEGPGGLELVERHRGALPGPARSRRPVAPAPRVANPHL